MAKRKRSRHIPKDPFLAPDGTYVVPVSEELSGLATLGNVSLSGLRDGTISPAEFMRSTAALSDRELNYLIYQQAKMSVDNGHIKPWPEDDFGILMWFQMDFITPEMRETFPAIAREYLANEPMIGQKFSDIPVPRMNESTWDDAYNYRVLAIMVMAARRGSAYSRNFLIALYKVYYKSEYNRLRKLSKLTLIDLLEIFDEDCKRKGYPSGHHTGEYKPYGQYVIEKREHEAGWTNASGTRMIYGKPAKSPLETELDSSLNTFSELYDQPDEPPMPPVSSRLFIMCEMMHIEIDATCNSQAWEVNEGLGSITQLIFHNGPEMRHFRQILVDRNHDFLTTQYPEVTDPYIYQKDAKYFPLEVAEQVMLAAFRKYDRNIRLPYDSRQFKLDELLAEIDLSVHMVFPGIQYTYDQAQMLSMIHYLSECLCDLMIARDREIDSLLHFRARLNEGELDVSEQSDEWVIKTVEK